MPPQTPEQPPIEPQAPPISEMPEPETPLDKAEDLVETALPSGTTNMADVIPISRFADKQEPVAPNLVTKVELPVLNDAEINTLATGIDKPISEDPDAEPSRHNRVIGLEQVPRFKELVADMQAMSEKLDDVQAGWARLQELFELLQNPPEDANSRGIKINGAGEVALNDFTDRATKTEEKEIIKIPDELKSTTNHEPLQAVADPIGPPPGPMPEPLPTPTAPEMISPMPGAQDESEPALTDDIAGLRLPATPEQPQDS